jgi:ADP-dependent NAD(P)H-hydrate dehydratase / NAD(P)H-hydrate epimerase
MVITCRQMREAEEAAFARGVSAESLMNEAGEGIAKVIKQFFPRAGHAVLYLGKGNNAGDALVAARHLLDEGWQIHARFAFDAADFKELPAKHWKSLASKVHVARSSDELKHLAGTVVLLDGLVGIGAEGNLRGSLADAAHEMNELRRSRHATTIALDLPSGLDSGTISPGDSCVQADLTITIAHVKDILLADAATNFVGRLAVVPLRELDDARGDASKRVLTSQVLLPLLPKRPFDFHKGSAGRVGIIAGSRGFLGAAALCATGALRGGAGLVTLFVKEEIYPLIAALTPPEVMVKPVTHYHDVLREKCDVLAIGPGLGQEYKSEILEVIARAEIPAVIDADALNMLARAGLDELKRNSAPRLLTPHPGEMARLIAREPAMQKLSRVDLASAFAERFPNVTLLLKGSRTVIAAKDHPLSFNTTGNPGMASGGMGDVLTGLCAALAAQGVALHDAACLGAWLSGRAAEIALRDGSQSEESLSAGDVLHHLGAAFGELRALVY